MLRRDLKNLISIIIAISIFIYPNVAIDMLFLYTVIDCFGNKLDFIIHHLIVMLIYYQYKTINFENEDLTYMISSLIKPEISTIPLQLMNLMKYYGYDKNIFYNITKIAFFTTFVYFRIIDYPIIYYFDVEFNRIIIKYDLYIISDIIFYSFYTLNLYWLLMIIKKLM